MVTLSSERTLKLPSALCASRKALQRWRPGFERDAKPFPILSVSGPERRGVFYLVISAARRPAAATTSVCGDPFDLDAGLEACFFWNLDELLLRKSGRFSSVRGLSNLLVSSKAFAAYGSVFVLIPAKSLL